MKTKQLLCSIALLLLPFVICSASQERSLTKILQELRIELQTSYIQRSEAQKALNEDYERQHQRMLSVIKSTNELSLLLYTQEQKRTMDMAFALMLNLKK